MKLPTLLDIIAEDNSKHGIRPVTTQLLYDLVKKHELAVSKAKSENIKKAKSVDYGFRKVMQNFNSQ